jgi:ABC-type transporter Mla MlaB component
MTTRATIAFTVWGPILRSDIPGLTARVCGLLEKRAADVALCEVRNLVVPDAVTVEALARLQLGAQRHRCRVILLHASEELLELVAFMGLSDVIAG